MDIAELQKNIFTKAELEYLHALENEFLNHTVKFTFCDHEDRHEWKEKVAFINEIKWLGSKIAFIDDEGTAYWPHPESPVEVVYPAEYCRG